MKKLAVLLCLLVAVPLALGACGGGDEEETVANTVTDVTATEPPDQGETVEVSADPTGELRFEQESLQADAGKITFELTNDATLPHDFVVEQDGDEITRTDTITADQDTTSAELEPGRYTFYCSVDGHREAGMEGTLTVR